MSVSAKCTNYTNCLLAYRSEEIQLPADAPMVCPECGKPLTEAKKGGSGLWKLIPIVAVVAVLLIGGLVAWPIISKLMAPSKPVAAETTEPSPAPAETSATETAPEQPAPTETVSTSPTPPPVTPSVAPTPGPTAAAEPPTVITAPARIDMDLGKSENKRVKDEVLTRIDLMPNLSESNKDKLYASVERARSMGKLLTIPFASGKTTLAPADIEALKSELESAELKRLREDPTTVFVVLGYADPKGDQKKNLAISQSRADAVVEAMRDKAMVSNVMHPVAMGSSTLLDAQNLEKNRIVEVWAVRP